MALDAFIFDVDGTLIDTNAVHAEVWKKALAHHGYDIPADRIAPEIGKGGDFLLPSVIGEAAAKKDQDALEKTQGEFFLETARTRQFPIFPGAAELLKSLKARGFKIAIATSAKREFLEAIEKSAGWKLTDLADEVVTASDAQNSKPAPDLVNSAVQKLGLSPAQCAMVGDTPYDADSCRHAGVVCLGVLCGGNEEKVLRGAGMRGVWRDPANLLNHLDEVLRLASPGALHLTEQVMRELMAEALKVAREGMENGEVPIAALLARGTGEKPEIIARGYNELNGTQNKISHAEIVTFNHAAGKVPVEARDLILVSTLEPCVMCTGAAMEAAVDTIVYALQAPADSGTGRVQPPESPESQMPRIVPNILADESRALFLEWLEKNGNTPQAAFVKQLLALTAEGG